MTTKKVLLQEIEQTPDALLQEVLDFLIFIRSKYSNGATSSSADLSQSTGHSLLESLDGMGTWRGDDFETCLQRIYDSRSQITAPEYNPFYD